MPETIDTPQTTETAKKPATRSAQDTRIANNIADARTLVSQTQADSALVAKLTTRGFPATRLTALVALQSRSCRRGLHRCQARRSYCVSRHSRNPARCQ